MRPTDGTVPFGPWLPDLPALDNPGLIEAVNVLPISSSYRPFRSHSPAGDALAARPRGALEIHHPSSGNTYLYAGTQTAIYRQNTAIGTWTDVKSGAYSASTEAWEFTVYDTLVLATNYFNNPEKATIGTGNFSTLAATGTAPKARRIGKIGQFVFLGDTNDGVNVVPNRVQWCGIDDPTNWSTPGTAAAVAVQAGAETLDPAWGAVNAIVGGDQFGIIMQSGGLTRVTYEGGSTVFRFDKIAGAAGLYLPHSVVEQNGLWYYISRTGFCMTDGVRAEFIGRSKVDTYFFTNFGGSERERVYGAMNPGERCVYWNYPTSVSSTPDRLIFYNVDEKRFARAEATCEVLVPAPLSQGQTQVATNVRAFSSSNVYGEFSASTYPDAFLTTGEQEFQPGGQTLLQGIKPLISGPASNITVAVGTRSSQSSSVTFSAETTPTTRTGIADFRLEARYHRARIKITDDFGPFTTAQGLEWQQVPTGSS